MIIEVDIQKPTVVIQVTTAGRWDWSTGIYYQSESCVNTAIAGGGRDYTDCCPEGTMVLGLVDGNVNCGW